MKAIEDIWKQGNEQVGQDNSFTSEAILKSIADDSGSITAGLLKTLRFGIIVALMAVLLFIYNAFFYGRNLPLMITILVLIAISLGLILFLWSQARLVKGLDQRDLNLRDLLIYKIRYLNTRYNWAMYGVSLSIVLATFTINLTIENPDGIFELRKILILSVFYLFAYLFTYGLIKLSLNVVNKQLKNALFNLEEKTFRGLDGELRKHRQVSRMIALGLAILALSGIVLMLLS